MRKTILFMLSMALLGCQHSAISNQKLENECLYSPEKTQFAFWSNAAEQMEVLIYNDGMSATSSLNDSASLPNDVQTVPLEKGENDFWTATVKGDLAGKYYTVRSFQNGEWSQPAPGISPKPSASTAKKQPSSTCAPPIPKDGPRTCAQLCRI